MLTKLILLSPNDYENIKKECFKEQPKSNQHKIGEKMSKSELLKDWYEIRERTLQQNLQNRKNMRQKDSAPIKTKKTSGIQTSPVKTSPVKKSSIKQKPDTASSDSEKEETPLRVKKKLHYFTANNAEDADDDELKPHDMSDDQARPVVKKRRRRPVDIYKENTERKKSLREKKTKTPGSNQRGEGSRNFSFIKHWVSI